MITYDTRLKEYGDMLKEAFPIVNFEITDKMDIDDTKWAFWKSDDRIICAFNLEKARLYDPQEKKEWLECAKDIVRMETNKSEKYGITEIF